MGILGIPTVLKSIRPRFPSLPTRRPLGGTAVAPPPGRDRSRLPRRPDCDLAGAAPGSRPSPPAVARTGVPCSAPGVLWHRQPASPRTWGSVHGPGGVWCLVLSQSEDQNRPHPVLTFVHPMSTQVRSLGLDAVKGGPRYDPQIATRARNRASRQAVDHPENCIEPPESRATSNQGPPPPQTNRVLLTP